MFVWKCPYCKKNARELGIGDRRSDHALHAKQCHQAVQDAKSKFDILMERFGSGIDYRTLRKELYIRNADDVDVSVIVPVRGRANFHGVLVDHIRRSAEKVDKTFAITFVEHSQNPDHKAEAEKSGANYIHIPTDGVFNKCLAFNVGFLFSNKAQYYMFHDLDCVMQSNFWFNMFLNLDRTPFNALQSFADRRVLYCDETTTQNIIAGNTNVDTLGPQSPGVQEPARHQWKAPGGSVFVPHDQFVAVGGFDPEYFFGYSIEDGFFYNKLEISGGIASCNNPRVELFHLNHPPLWNSNPHLADHHQIYEDWMAMSGDDKIRLMEVKSQHLKKFIHG